MKQEHPESGASGTTDQSPRWEGPKGTKASGYVKPKDDPDAARDANGENLNDPRVRKVSDALKQRYRHPVEEFSHGNRQA